MLIKLNVTISNRQRFFTEDTTWTSTLRGWYLEVSNTEKRTINRLLETVFKNRVITWSIDLH